VGVDEGACVGYFFRGGHLRPQTGVVLNCELIMVAGTANNQAQYPEVADST